LHNTSSTEGEQWQFQRSIWRNCGIDLLLHSFEEETYSTKSSTDDKQVVPALVKSFKILFIYYFSLRLPFGGLCLSVYDLRIKVYLELEINL
jgi:hypothetical protein